MQAPVDGIDQVRERLEIRVQELRLLPPLLDDVDDGVQLADLGEHARVRGIPGLALAVGGQAEAIEQDLAELLGRPDHERPSGQLVAACLELLHLIRELRGDLGQAVGVDADAHRLHGAEHRDQRELDALVQADHVAVGQLPVEAGVQPPSSCGGPDDRRGLLVGADLDTHTGLLGKVVDLVAGPARIEQVRGDRRIARRLERRLLSAHA